VTDDPITRANDLLQARGYKEAQLAVFAAPLPGKALLKGLKMHSPFADSPETVLRAVEQCVPTAEALGRRQLTPHELRDCLAG
jgi:hypothetical protein